MNSFVKGMGSLNLFPRVEKNKRSPAETAWEGVGKAFEDVGRDFKAVGDDLRWAMDQLAKEDQVNAGK
ncbi:MAG: hypothetical protein LBQ38_12165 [Spirochaetaceae bacterium]|jgi:hypothetical protein|nr:hypothetical protein [Spirochaetaceae bacterium]